MLEEVKPQLLILCHGGNDFLRRLDEGKAAANVRSMIHLARSQGIAVMLISTPKPGWGVSKVKFLPDGSGHFTRRMGMLINKEHLGFGYRSWRYAMVVNDGVIETWFEEPGINDEGSDADPYTVTNPETLLTYLRSQKAT